MSVGLSPKIALIKKMFAAPQHKRVSSTLSAFALYEQHSNPLSGKKLSSLATFLVYMALSRSMYKNISALPAHFRLAPPLTNSLRLAGARARVKVSYNVVCCRILDKRASMEDNATQISQNDPRQKNNDKGYLYKNFAPPFISFIRQIKISVMIFRFSTFFDRTMFN